MMKEFVSDDRMRSKHNKPASRIDLRGMRVVRI